jgi:homoserine acetyltransferase
LTHQNVAVDRALFALVQRFTGVIGNVDPSPEAMSSQLAGLADQDVFVAPSFELECGVVLRDAPVAYKTWGTLNERRDNVMIISHAFTGSADSVEDWSVEVCPKSRSHVLTVERRWAPLMGPGKAFDLSQLFIFCANVLDSPYGSASPATTNPDTGKYYYPGFSFTTIQDDVRLVPLLSSCHHPRADCMQDPQAHPLPPRRLLRGPVMGGRGSVRRGWPRS